jgi:hypothetical protein
LAVSIFFIYGNCAAHGPPPDAAVLRQDAEGSDARVRSLRTSGGRVALDVTLKLAPLTGDHTVT